MRALSKPDNKVFQQLLKKYDILNDEPGQAKPKSDKKVSRGFQNADQEQKVETETDKIEESKKAKFTKAEIQDHYKQKIREALKVKFILEQDLQKKLSQLKMTLSPQMLNQHFTVGMSKVSDALTCSS